MANASCDLEKPQYVLVLTEKPEQASSSAAGELPDVLHTAIVAKTWPLTTFSKDLTADDIKQRRVVVGIASHRYPVKANESGFYKADRSQIILVDQAKYGPNDVGTVTLIHKPPSSDLCK